MRMKATTRPSQKKASKVLRFHCAALQLQLTRFSFSLLMDEPLVDTPTPLINAITVMKTCYLGLYYIVKLRISSV